MANKRNITTWAQVEVYPSAEELAEVFWDMDAEEQAGFFHHLEKISDGGLCFQLAYIVTDPEFTESARRAMQTIGEYGERL